MKMDAGSTDFRNVGNKLQNKRTSYLDDIFNNREYKVKVNFTLEQATKAQRGSRSIALLFLQPRG